jgi:salicylate 5-hydroxylase small subunit
MNTIDPQQYLDLQRLYADYAAAVDASDWDAWVDMFTDDCDYRVQPRENFDRGMPLATIALISKGMLKDRVYGIRETLFHDPYYQRHVTGAARVTGREDGILLAGANYAVFRTKPNGDSTVFNVGRYIDRIAVTEGGLKFAARLVVYDSEMIPNSLIYPI